MNNSSIKHLTRMVQGNIKAAEDRTLTSATIHCQLGLAVHWVKPASKAPVSTGWAKAPASTIDDLRKAYRSNFNAGFRPGKYSVIEGKEVVVLDVDVKHHDYADEAYKAANEVMGGAFRPNVISGSGVGRHQYLLMKKGSSPDKAAITLCYATAGATKDGKIVPLGTHGSVPAWTIELLSTGKNVVMPPSIHPDTHRQYEWVNEEDMGRLDDAPESLLALLNGESDWPEPESIKFDLLPVNAFDPNLLPVVMRKFVCDIADRTQCPIDFVAVVVVQLIGTVVGNACVIRPKQLDDWAETPNLWAAIVGRPGQLKTPAKNMGFEPLRHLEWEAQQEYQQAVCSFENDKVERELEIQQLKAVKNRTQEQHDRLASLLKAKPVEPVLRRYKTSDATVEKLGELHNLNPRGLLVDRDELVGWFATFQKAGREMDRSFYLEGWNGNGCFTVDRIGRGTTLVDRLTLLVFGSIQPAKLQQLLYDAKYGYGNDGLIQRFQLMVYPDDTGVWRLVDREPDKASLDEMISLVRKLANCDFASLGAQIDDRRSISFFRYTDEAQTSFNEWFVTLGQRVAAEEQPLIAEHLGKYRKLVPALSLIFHLIDLGTGELASGSSIGLSSLQRAVAWAEYLESHARRVYHLAIDVSEDAVKSLANKLSCGELRDGFSERDVYRNKWANLSEPELVSAACSELVMAGWIRQAPREKTSGRPTVRYEINPAVLTKKNE